MPAVFDFVWLAAVLALIVGVYAVGRLWVRREGGSTKRLANGRRVIDDATRGSSGLGASPLVTLERPAPTRHPLVFVHGFMGFDTVGIPGLRHEYFRGVRSALEALGYSVVFVRVSPTAGIERRAAQLARHIQDLGAPRVNIVAHSMGGLDARYAIARLGLADRIASLTTVGTPHRGTPLADTAELLSSSRAIRRALAVMGVDGICDLTTRQMDAFNRAVGDAPSVVYSSVVGSVPFGGLAPVHALLAPAHAYLARRAGDNDGIVPRASQPWGSVLTEIQADHWAQVGWSGGFDARGFYVFVAERLARQGL